MFEMLDKFLTISQLNFSLSAGIKMLKKPVDQIKLSNLNDVNIYMDNNVISTNYEHYFLCSFHSLIKAFNLS